MTWTNISNCTVGATTAYGGATGVSSAYYSGAISGGDSTPLEFQHNGSTFYTATETGATLNGLYPSLFLYYGTTTTNSINGISNYTDDGLKITFTIDKKCGFLPTTCSWTGVTNAMDQEFGIASSSWQSSPGQTMLWNIIPGQRSPGGGAILELWKNSSGDIKYSASISLNDGDTISIVYSSGAPTSTTLLPPPIAMVNL